MAETEGVVTPKITKKSKDKETSYRIEEIENGFVVTQSIEYKSKNGEYKYESRKFYTKENPIEEEAENMYDIMVAALGNNEI